MAVQCVRELMTQNPTCCTPQDPVNQAARIMVEEDCGAVPVVESLDTRRLAGIVTDRDIACRVVAADLYPKTTQVRQAMSCDMITVRPDSTVDECVRLMAQEQVRRMPIVDAGGILVGIVAQADLARAADAHADMEEDLADVVEEVSQPTLGAR